MKKNLSALAILSLVSSLVASASAVAAAFDPKWNELGSGQILSNVVGDNTNVEGMNSEGNPVTGAITKVLVDPSNNNIIYAGAVNGGIWKTTDGGISWNPLTDRLSSLSIGAMNFDSTDPTSQTIIAGIGKQSAFGSASGPLTGIQYSSNGGTTWSELGKAVFNNKDITGVAARGTIMMAAVRDISTPITTVGLYRSTDSGANFSNSVTGLPVGNIQNLAADPSNASRFYLSVVNGNSNTAGIYRSDDTGATWTQVKAVTGLSTADSSGRILLSVGANGVLAAQIQQGKPTDTNYILQILRTDDQGSTWVDLGKPAIPGFTGLFPGGQSTPHGVILVDPANPNIVYAAGDTQVTITNSSIGAKQYTCPVFRGVYNPVTHVTAWSYITNDNTLSGSAAHADSRTFAVDSNGTLLFGCDGGLFAYPNAASTTILSDWIPIMDDLRTTEMTQSSWNSVTHTVSASAQDMGAFYQYPGQKGSYDWSSTSGGDGGPGPVNVLSKGPNISIVYASSQALGGFKRFEVGKTDDAAKAKTTLTQLDPKFNGVSISGNESYMSFLSLVALNRTNPKKMAIGGKRLFIGTDDLTIDTVNGYSFPVTSILPGDGTLPSNNEISSLVYGTNVVGSTALLAGSGSVAGSPGYLYYTPIAGTTAMTNLGGYAGKYVWKAIFDERDGSRFYVADGTDVWRSTDTGVTFAKINGDPAAGGLPANFVDRRGLAFAANNGVNALFVGGVSNTANGSGIYVTQYTSSTGADSPTPSWSAFGGNLDNALANAPVYGLSYDTTDDVLLVNLLGRGAWAVYDLTTYFPEATTLIFGKADNDSAPDASLLTNGTTGGRGLTKTGAGTLTLSGISTYTGATTISSGVLSIAGTNSLPGWNTNGSYSVANGAALAVGNGVSEANVGAIGSAGTILNTSNFLAGARLGFDTTAGNRTYASVIGNTSNGALGLTKISANTLTLSAANTYTGVTTIIDGTLSVATIGNGGVAGNLGAASNAAANLVFNGGILEYSGATAGTDRNFTINAGSTATIQVDGNVLTMSGASTTTTGGLTKTGAGTLLLSGANLYTGATTVNAGTLQAGVDTVAGVSGAFGLGSAMTVASSGTLDLGGFNEAIGSLAGTGTVTNSGAAKTLTVGDATSTSFSGIIQDGTGAINLTKTGAGTLTLSGTNTYLGGTTISAGVLSIAVTNSLPGWNTNGSYSVANGATLAVGNGVLDPSIVTIIGTSNFTAGASLGFDTSADRTYASVIGNTSNGALGLTKISANTLTLSAANTYTGVTTISGGTISVATIGNGGVAGNLGKATNAAGNLVLDGGTLQYTGANASTDRAFTITAAKTGTIDISTAGSTLTMSGASASTTGGLTKTGAGTLLLSGANLYTGATTVNTGTLQAGVAGQAFGNNSVVTLNNADGGGLNLNNFNNTIGSLNGLAASTVVLGSGTLTISVNADTDRSGNYAGIISGTGGLTVAGTFPGTQVLTGANLYSGVTTISDTSTLQIGDAGTTGTLGTGAVTDNAFLAFNRTDRLTVSNAISGSGALEQKGTGILVLSGANTYAGITTVSAGVLSIAGTGSLPGWNSDGRYLVDNGATLAVGNGVSEANVGAFGTPGTMLNTPNFLAGASLGFDSSIDRTYASVIGDTSNGALGLTKIGTNKLTLSVANTYTGVTTITDGTISVATIGNGGVAGNLGAAANDAGNLVFNGGILEYSGVTAGTDRNFTINAGSTATIQVDGNVLTMSGASAATTGGLTKTGAGTLLFSGANTYSGATTVSAGILKAGVASVLSTSGAFGLNSAVILNNADGGGLNLNNFDNTIGSLNGVATSTVVLGSGTLTTGINSYDNYAGVISGTGGLAEVGGGTQILTGANLYSGTTTISGTSTLQIGNAGTTGTLGTGAVTNNAALKYNRSDVVPAISNVISGTGTFEQAGTGTVTLSGANTYSGATIVSAGTLKAGVASVPATSGAFGLNSAVTVGTAGTLDLGGFNETIGSLSGAGIVTNTVISNKTLTAGGNATSTSFSGIIRDGGAGKIMGFDKEGAGTFTLSGANAYTGTTVIGGGTLQVANAGALGTSAVTNNATLNIGTTSLGLGSGTYTQGAGSTLVLIANSSSGFGNITTTGKVITDGSSVNVTVGGYISNGTALAIINGAATSTYAATAITSSDPRLTFSGLNSNGDFILTVDRSTSGFSSLGTNSNTSTVGAVLDNISNPSGDMSTVLNTLEGLSNSQTESALATVVPVVDSGVTMVSNTAINEFMGTSSDRLGGLFAQAQQEEETGVSTGSKGKSGFEAWGRGFGEYAQQDPRGLSNGYHATIWGTAIGGDIPIFNDRARIGADGGYASSNVSSKDNSGKTYIDSYQSTFYGGFMDPEKPYYINGAFSFAYNTYKGRRNIAVGTITRTANSNYKGQQYSVLFDGGYTIKTKQVNITPIASLQYLRLNLQSYTETGADALDLSVKGQGYNLLESGLGAKFDRLFEVSCGTLIPEAHIRWFYDIITDKQATTSTFSGGGGSFATNGFTPARNALNVGGRLALVTKGNWSFDANYDFEYKQDFTSHTGWADIRYSF